MVDVVKKFQDLAGQLENETNKIYEEIAQDDSLVLDASAVDDMEEHIRTAIGSLEELAGKLSEKYGKNELHSVYDDVMEHISSQYASSGEAVFVPDLVEALSLEYDVDEIKEAILDAGKKDELELRPGSLLGGYEEEVKNLMPKAHDGTPISYVRPRPKKASIMNSLAYLADDLDERGMEKHASVLDDVLQLFSKNAQKDSQSTEELKKLRDEYRTKEREKNYQNRKKSLDKQNDKENTQKAVEEKVRPFKALEAPLKTRYCPDHPGVHLIRVGDDTYQCSLDYKLYNYESGYNTYKGNKIPGGNVSNQTNIWDHQSGHAVFDSREARLSRFAAAEDDELIGLEELENIGQEYEEPEREEYTFDEFGLEKLEDKFPEAYKALPEPYKADSKALTFFIDINNYLIAEHDLGGAFLWEGDTKEWVEIEDIGDKSEEASFNELGLKPLEEFGLKTLEDKFPEAYEALPEPYKADSALTFFIDVNDYLIAEHDLGGAYGWDEYMKKWMEIEDTRDKI